MLWPQLERCSHLHLSRYTQCTPEGQPGEHRGCTKADTKGAPGAKRRVCHGATQRKTPSICCSHLLSHQGQHRGSARRETKLAPGRKHRPHHGQRRRCNMCNKEEAPWQRMRRTNGQPRGLQQGATQGVQRGRTTEAPSPSSALSAKSGTGNHEGLPNTFPSRSHSSDTRTGLGAHPLTTPALPPRGHEATAKWKNIDLTPPQALNHRRSTTGNWESAKVDSSLRHPCRFRAVCPPAYLPRRGRYARGVPTTEG